MKHSVEVVWLGVEPLHHKVQLRSRELEMSASANVGPKMSKSNDFPLETEALGVQIVQSPRD